MTEQEAIRAAWRFVERESLGVVGVHSVQRIASDQLPEHKKARGDFWVVRFDRETPVDTVETPSLFLINVDDRSGEVSLFDSL